VTQLHFNGFVLKIVRLTTVTVYRFDILNPKLLRSRTNEEDFNICLTVHH